MEVFFPGVSPGVNDKQSIVNILDTIEMWRKQLMYAFQNLQVSGGGTVGTDLIEFGIMDYNASGVQFILTNGYLTQPYAVASMIVPAGELGTSSFQLAIEFVTEEISGQTLYSKVNVTPSGTSIPASLTNGKINLILIGQSPIKKA